MYPTWPYTEKKKLRLSTTVRASRASATRQKVLGLILFFTVARLFVASAVELGNDETYYWLYTQSLQWNYFDHPPMVAIWGRLFTFGLALDHYEAFVRLGSIVSCALSSFFIYKATSLFHSEKAGWFAVILYNTSFYAGVVSGIFIMPDSPQMVFWTLSLWMLARIIQNDKAWSGWIIFGIAAGLCIMSKVHGAFIWVSFGLFTLFCQRTWLLKPQPYIAALLTFIVISPIIIWNVQHDFATYRFHSARVTFDGTLDLKNFLSELTGQFFFNNPVNVLLTIFAIAAITTSKKKLSPAIRLLLLTGLPLAVCLLFVSLSRHVFPHWSGPAYVSLIPVAAIYLYQLNERFQKLWSRFAIGAALVFLIGWPALIHFYPGTWGSQSAHDFGKGDVSLDRYGWKEAGNEFMDLYRTEVREGRISSNTPVVCNTWWGAHVEYYFCQPAGIKMIGLGTMKEVHHYLWTNAERKSGVDFTSAFAVVPSDEYFDVQKHYSKYYTQVELVRNIEIHRNGKKAHHFSVYKLSGWNNILPEIN